jgi:hypothetical protein
MINPKHEMQGMRITITQLMIIRLIFCLECKDAQLLQRISVPE